MNYILFFILGLEIKASTLYWKALIACAVIEAIQISYKLYIANGKGR